MEAALTIALALIALCHIKKPFIAGKDSVYYLLSKQSVKGVYKFCKYHPIVMGFPAGKRNFLRPTFTLHNHHSPAFSWGYRAMPSSMSQMQYMQ